MFGSATRGTRNQYDNPLEDVLGIDTRAMLLATAPVLINAVVGYAGLGVGYTWFNHWYSYSDDNTRRVTENRVVATVPVGFRYELSRWFLAGAEMETPVAGWFRDDVSDVYGIE